jgi:hypothetical protein
MIQFLLTGQKKCGFARAPYRALGLALGHGETAGRYSDGERISAGAAFLTPGAMAGGGQEKWGADPEADLPAEAPTVQSSVIRQALHAFLSLSQQNTD